MGGPEGVAVHVVGCPVVVSDVKYSLTAIER